MGNVCCVEEEYDEGHAVFNSSPYNRTHYPSATPVSPIAVVSPSNHVPSPEGYVPPTASPPSGRNSYMKGGDSYMSPRMRLSANERFVEVRLDRGRAVWASQQAAQG